MQTPSLAGPVELVIFDCDGVLIDSERLALAVDKKVLSDLGWHLTDAEIIDRFVGKAHENFVAQVEAYLGHPLPVDWETRYQPWYDAAYDAELVVVPGVLEALDALDAAGITTCVASSGSHAKLRRTLGHVGLYERFEGRIFAADDVTESKPAPDLFLLAADRMGVPASRCLVVEDSQYGVQAARAAGMRALGFGGGVTPAPMLEGANTVIFHDMRELPGLVQRLGPTPDEPSAVGDHGGPDEPR